LNFNVGINYTSYVDAFNSGIKMVWVFK
jgi:hypothetical protein